MSLEGFYADEEEVKGRMFLLYGLPGAGKTYTALTSSVEGRDVLVADTELRAMEKKKKYFDKGNVHIVELVQLGTLMQMPALEGFDDEKTISRLGNLIMQYHKEGPDNGVFIVDTMSEVWKFVQSAGKRRLAKAGKVDLDTLAMKSQFDWGTITAMHMKIMLMLRVLTRDKGTDVILTARANHIPDYVGAQEDIYMMSQKDVPFLSDVVIQLRRQVPKGRVRMEGSIEAIFDKAGESDSAKIKPIKNPTFEEILEAIE